MAHYYKDSTVGDGVPENPLVPANDDAHQADEENFLRHYRREGGSYVCYIASDVRIPNLEDHEGIQVLEEPPDEAVRTPSEVAAAREGGGPPAPEPEPEPEPEGTEAEDEEE